MAAIITSNFRLENCDKFLSEVATRSYYLYIGRTEQWVNSTTGLADDTAIATPRDRYADVLDVWQKMISIKKIAAAECTNAISRYNWVSGQTYSEYDDQDESLTTKRYYVITDDYNVYKCIKAGSGPSIIKPTGQALTLDPRPSADGGDEKTDGYLWKFMYTLTGNDVTRFLTSSFIPVRTLTSDDGTIQWNVQQAAVNGAIYRIKVTSGGAGYTSAPTVSFEGNGSGAAATAVVSGGVVTSIVVTSIGSGYNYAKVVLTGGGSTTAATCRAIISPRFGHGKDPKTELNGVFAMTTARLSGADGDGDFITGNDFRQLGILVDPYDYGTTNIATATTMSATRSMTYSGAGGFLVDQILTQSSNGAQAVIDSVNTSTNTIKFHQNASTGYKAFSVGGTITTTAGGTGVISTLDNPEVQPFTGKVIYLENRAPVSRATDQTEDIKLVVEF